MMTASLSELSTYLDSSKPQCSHFSQGGPLLGRIMDDSPDDSRPTQRMSCTSVITLLTRLAGLMATVESCRTMTASPTTALALFLKPKFNPYVPDAQPIIIAIMVFTSN